MRCFWTREVKVEPVPVPWQFWMFPPGGGVRDVVQLAGTFGSPVTIQREFAIQPTIVPIDDLGYDMPAAWQPDPAGPITQQPGMQADLEIPANLATDGAVLVGYDVRDPLSGEVVSRFANELLIGMGTTLGLEVLSDKVTFVFAASVASQSRRTAVSRSAWERFPKSRSRWVIV